MRFIGEHLVFGAARAFALLPADALDLRAFRGDKPVLPFLNLIEQQAPGDVAVQSLLARFLAFNLESGGAMNQHDARGRLVHVLPAVAARAHKGFLDVRLAHAEAGHAPRELGFLFHTDGKCTHGLLYLNHAAFGRLFQDYNSPLKIGFEFNYLSVLVVKIRVYLCSSVAGILICRIQKPPYLVA